jgi:hypothetical protein
MFFINHLRPDEWWEWNKEKMMAYNYRGGHHNINENDLGGVEYCEYESWHELYLAKGFCPFEVDKWECEVWISPEGKYYEGRAHAVMAEYICDIIYGEDIDFDFAEDYLEEHGWVRATTSLMWEVRFDSWENKRVSQKQYDALFDWCECHKKDFPKKLEVY